MAITDTHIHLYSEEFKEDRLQLIKQAINKGVSRFFMPNIDVQSVVEMKAVVNEFPDNCFMMMGLHPCYVKDDYQAQLHQLKTLIAREKIVGIGEIGIDLYWDKTHFQQQQQAFRTQIQWAIEYKLPYIIHSRNAFDETLEIVNEFKNDNLKAIFHCFSGNVAQAEKVINAGKFKLGIGGVVTYKNSGLDEVVKEIDLQHLVLETDAPYLAPIPYRGKRNIPEYITFVAQKIAEIKNISLEEVMRITTQNSIEVFGC